MTLINVATLKQQLSLENISYENISDANLELLLNNVISELTGRIGLPITTENHKEIIRDFNNDMLELDHYPVSGITSFVIGSKTLSESDYVLDERLGIIYLTTVMKGLLVIEYSTVLPTTVIDAKINPLVFDIIKYRLINGFSINGNISSIKEIDTQVNYDTSSSLGNLIESRINNLRSSYSVRIKVL